MNKKRHGTFFVLDRELFSLKKIQKKFKKITERHGTCRTVSLSPSHNIFPLSSNDLLNIENKSKLKEENKYKDTIVGIYMSTEKKKNSLKRKKTYLHQIKKQQGHRGLRSTFV